MCCSGIDDEPAHRLFLLPARDPAASPDLALAKRMEFANKEMQVRLQYWTGCWPAMPSSGPRSASVSRGDRYREPGQSGHGQHPPSESVASRRAGLDKLKSLLPELGLDAQAFLRSWIALGEELLARDSRRDDQSQEVQRLRRQIEQLSAIDDQLNQRKLNGNGEALK